MKKFLKKYVGIMVVVSIMSVVCVVGNCDEATNTAMTTALTGVKSDGISALAVVAPIGIAIMGAFLVWRYGIKFFKSLSK